MKITEISSFLVQDDSHRKYFIVRVDTDVGIHGLGEVGIANWSGAITQAIEHLKDVAVGADPFSTEKLWQTMFRGSFFPADRVYSAAISAIDIACWDIKGKALGLPVYKLLGGPVRDKVQCYPHNMGGSLEQLVDSCTRTAEEGWKFVRFHLPSAGESSKDPSPDSRLLDPRQSIALAEQWVAGVREELGDDINICLDVHTRLDTAHSIELCCALERYRLYFVEDPLRSENPTSYRTLSRHTHVPIAAGEQWSSKWGFREVIEEELVSYARIDLCIVGGLTEALKVTHACETHYIDIVPHNPLGPVSAAAGVALCMASTNVGVQEMPQAPGSYAQDLFPKQIEFHDGYASSPDAPGLGVEFDVDVAEHRRVKGNGWPPHLHRPDGSFTNW